MNSQSVKNVGFYLQVTELGSWEKKLREFINDNLFLKFWNNFHFSLSITLKI